MTLTRRPGRSRSGVGPAGTRPPRKPVEAAGAAPASEAELNTVSVPAPLAPLFLKAQDYVRRYFGDRVERPDQSTISISGERYVLVRAASMSVEFFDLVTSLYRDEGAENARAVAANLLFDLAHAIGKADARSFLRKMKVDDPVEKLSAGPIHFAFAGWAFVKIHPESAPAPDDEYYLVYDHPFSFESDAWLTRGRKSDAPVCIMNSGYSSGWCEESFGLPLVAAEIECLAAGDEHCRFIMAPPSRIEERLAAYQGKSAAGGRRLGAGSRVTVPEFFRRKRLEDELRQHREQLERRVEERTGELLRTNELLRAEITERKRTEHQLRLLGSAVQNAEEGMVIMSPEFDAIGPRILFVNRGFTRMTGLAAEEVVGETLRLLAIEPTDRPVEAALHEHLSKGKAFRGEMAARRKDGSPYYLELHVMPVLDMAEGPKHWIGILRDVSERKSQLAALEHQALHDSLTDLPNRVLLMDRLEQALLAANRTKGSIALLFLDLDRFKDVNDTFGHACGDLLLREVGVRLRRELRASDSVSRLGGDEFAVLLPVLDDPVGATETARKILAEFEEPFAVEGQSLDVGASIGIAIAPEHGTDGQTLMRRADVAMYVAKRRGGGYALYSPDQDPYTPTRLSLMGDLRTAADRSELRLDYQPIVGIAARDVRRVEALVRWDHPRHGVLPPDHFVPQADRSGIIDTMTEHVVALACQQARAWRDAGMDLGVVVNVSVRNVQDPQLPARVRRALETSGLDASSLSLDIAETGIVADPQNATKVLRALREMGIRLSLDDFGTGYSSLVHLKHLPVSEVKIDRTFVRGLASNPTDAAIVKSTIEMSHHFGHQVVAVGVEDEETLTMLSAFGCDLAQGHHLCPPLPASALEAWVRGRSAA